MTGKGGAESGLEPHYRCSEQRLRQHPRVLCIQDTTELDSTGKSDIEGLGPLNYETRRGLYRHPTVAVTPERWCLGVLDAWSWTREPGSLGEDKGQRPIEAKESVRWLEGYQRVSELQAQTPETQLIYVGDRKADIYELFAECHQSWQSQPSSAEWLIRAEIEIFFKILNSGCQVEELHLEKRERLQPALAFYVIIAWRVLYLTMLGRTCPELPCKVVFAEEEWQAVYIVAKRQPPPEVPPPLDEMVRMVASFGGFLNRKGDGFPGPQTVWIGLQRSRNFILAMEAQRVMRNLSYG